MVELSCECGNEDIFTELTTVDFTVDAEGNREEKINETTQYRCGNCGKPAEVCDTSKSCEVNGFHNTPAGCENSECADCQMADDMRKYIDCPYIKESETQNES